MKNVSYDPDWILYSTQFYGPQAAKAAKALGSFPPGYVQFTAVPFELADKFPAVKQAKEIVEDAVSDPKLSLFTLSSFNAWLLFAESAKACGSDLTVDCVLEKAADHTEWNAGGLYPTVDLRPSERKTSPCIALVKLTDNGFEYDEKATNPGSDYPFNCNPANVQKVKTYVAS